jgi:hypothetical protein
MDIKNPAFIGAFGLIALILGLTGWYMSTHPAPVVTREAVIPGNGIESDTPKNFSENERYSTISVTYPTNITFPLSSNSDAGAHAERVMKAWVDKAVTEFKGYAKENEASIAEFVAAGEEPPASLSSMQLTINYEKKSSPRALTYLFTSASYTGGAHGIEVPVTFTFNRTTGAQITLADLFTPDSNYLSRLSTIARAELPEMMGDYANTQFITEGTESRLQNFQTFYLEGDALVLLFPPYQVAPYVVGTVKLPIELSQLSDILRLEYRSE